jgi:hypothetical protein
MKPFILEHCMNKNGWIFLRSIFITCIMLPLFSCGTFGLSWKEEIQLLDGRIILVKRTAHGKPLGEIGGPGGWEPSEMTLEIDDPAIADKPPEWRFRYVPMLFDYDAINHEWFIVATFVTCTPWYDLGRPKLPYIEYRTRQGKWEVVPLDTALIGRKANLLTGVRSGGEPSLIRLEDKKDRDKRAAEEYKLIVSSWHTTC